MTRPNSRAAARREAQRAKGQFWTPDWIADALVRYALGAGSPRVFDPAVGAGSLFRATKRYAAARGDSVRLTGQELHASALDAARREGLSDDDLKRVRIGDFTLHPPTGPLPAIVANPPYIRHHRIPLSTKSELQRFTARALGSSIDGRAGLHVFFLIRALTLLESGGRLAFITSADICEGKFADRLWEWIVATYRLDGFVTFAPDATPFPTVDTNPVIMMIARETPRDSFAWARCLVGDSDALARWIGTDFVGGPFPELDVRHRSLTEGRTTGFTRPPRESGPDESKLSDFASVQRGVATGANDFFLMTKRAARAAGIPSSFLLPTVARTRDVPHDQLDHAWLDALEERGRPTLLFSPDGRPKDRFPKAVRAYLDSGEGDGLHARPLISTRRPWYRMERRRPPPILFTYLGRRRSRFVRNRTDAIPTHTFSCIYPHNEDPDFVDRLWRALNHEGTVKNLAFVGKSYGGGAIKVEPRALEKLPIPAEALESAGLTRPPRML